MNAENQKLSNKLKQFDGVQLEPRAERTYLNIIFALLDCIVGRFKEEKFRSEAQLRELIDEKFHGYYGLSSSTLGKKFALAKKSFNDQ